MKTLLLVSELALVNQKTRRGGAFFYFIHDVIEMHHTVFGFLAPQIEAQREIGRRQKTRDGDFHVLESFGRHRLARDDDGAVILPEARPVRQNGVAIRQVAIRMKADGAHLVLALESGLVQRLDVVEFMDEFIFALRDLPVRQGVET